MNFEEVLFFRRKKTSRCWRIIDWVSEIDMAVNLGRAFFVESECSIDTKVGTRQKRPGVPPRRPSDRFCLAISQMGVDYTIGLNLKGSK